MPNRDDLQWLDIDDFTPGMSAVYSTKMPPGTASMNSFGCWASRNGGLTGLPDNDFNYTPVSNPGYFDGTQQPYKIVGFLVIPAIISTDNTDYTAGAGHSAVIMPEVDDDPTPNHSVAFYIAYEAVNDILGPVQRRNLLMSVAVVQDPNAPNETALKDEYDADQILESTNVIHTYIAFARNIGDSTNPSARSPLSPGSPVVVASAIGLNSPDAAENIHTGGLYLVMTPDPTDLPNAFSPTLLNFGVGGDVGGGANMPWGRLLIHQGRILIADYQFWGRYDDSANVEGFSIQTNDLIYWTASNTANVEFQQSFGDRPYGFGTWDSLTSSDLFIITHYDGAVLVQGDLNAPIVRRFPGVVGTNGMECNGALSSVGYVYGIGGGGVYAWGGDDSSKCISMQLPDQFWVSPAASHHRTHKGTFAAWDDLLLAPNGYCMDTDTGAWWRIDNSDDPVINWQASPAGAYAYGTPAELANDEGNNGVAVRGYNKLSPREEWYWESHPFIPTAHRRIQVRQVVLMVKATTDSVIYVRIYTQEDTTPANETYTFQIPGDGFMHAYRITGSYDVFNMSASVECASGQCEVYGLRLGYVLRNNEPEYEDIS